MFFLKSGFLQFIQVDLSADVGPMRVIDDGQDVISPVLEGKKKKMTVTFSCSL